MGVGLGVGVGDLAGVRLGVGLGVALIGALLRSDGPQLVNAPADRLPMLFVEFHGSPAGVAEQSGRFGAIAGDFGGGSFEWAVNPEDRTRLWQARHDAYWAGRALRPGAQAVATDVCVPISRLSQCVVETQRDIAAHGLVAPILGHVGDGNFHLSLLVDMTDAAELKAARTLCDKANRPEGLTKLPEECRPFYNLMQMAKLVPRE